MNAPVTPCSATRARAAGIITLMAAAALAAAACSGSPSSPGLGGSPSAGGSANSSSGVAYSQCVRAHGVPNFPDPGSNGQIRKAAAIRALREVSDSRAKAATYACARLNPGQPNPVLTAQEQQAFLRAAACMRSHGFTNFPDPTFAGGHASLPRIPSSIDTKSRQFIQAEQTCIKLIPARVRPNAPGPGG
jgi:hypothetical protein